MEYVMFRTIVYFKQKMCNYETVFLWKFNFAIYLLQNFFSVSSVVQYRTCLFLFLFLYFIIYASLKWSLCSILCSYCVQGNIFLIKSLLLSSSEEFNRMISKFMCFCLNYFYLNTTVSNQEQVGGQDDPRANIFLYTVHAY